MEIPNFHEEKNENRFQKHQNIIVPNTQDDPNQIESDQNKSKRDIFFSPQTRCDENESKEQFIIHHKVLNLSSVNLTLSQIKILRPCRCY